MKQLHFLLSRKSNVFSIFLLISFFAASCNQSGKSKVQEVSDTSSNGGSGGNQHSTLSSAGLNATLHNLYITKAEIQTLKDSFPKGQFKNLALTFLFPENAVDGSPTLALWPNKKNSNNDEEFPNKTPQILHYGATSYVDVPKNLFLSNLQTKAAPLYTAVDTNRNCQSKCVLYFVPDGKDTLSYKVYVVVDSTKITKDYFTALDPVASLNPSPPHSAN